MKNLPCIIFLATLASLVLLAAASFAGLSFRFLHVALTVVGFSGAAGVLALFLVDYGPRRPLDRPAVSIPETKRETAPAAAAGFDQRRVVLRTKRPSAGSLAGGAFATLGLRNDPATLSLL
jgi:hypothetical protein